MATVTVNLPAARVVVPRAAEPLATWAAGLLGWLSTLLARASRPRDPRQDIAALWALAHQYEASQPGLAADLRGAALRWERETERP